MNIFFKIFWIFIIKNYGNKHIYGRGWGVERIDLFLLENKNIKKMLT